MLKEKKNHLRTVQKSSGKRYRERKKLVMSASWIGKMEKENEKVKEQEWENITTLELKAALTKSQ